jgi:hypothetical protein
MIMSASLRMLRRQMLWVLSPEMTTMFLRLRATTMLSTVRRLPTCQMSLRSLRTCMVRRMGIRSTRLRSLARAMFFKLQVCFNGFVVNFGTFLVDVSHGTPQPHVIATTIITSGPNNCIHCYGGDVHNETDLCCLMCLILLAILTFPFGLILLCCIPCTIRKVTLIRLFVSTDNNLALSPLPSPQLDTPE